MVRSTVTKSFSCCCNFPNSLSTSFLWKSICTAIKFFFAAIALTKVCISFIVARGSLSLYESARLALFPSCLVRQRSCSKSRRTRSVCARSLMRISLACLIVSTVFFDVMDCVNEDFQKRGRSCADGKRIHIAFCFVPYKARRGIPRSMFKMQRQSLPLPPQFSNLLMSKYPTL